jgi:hypothetical protein
MKTKLWGREFSKNLVFFPTAEENKWLVKSKNPPKTLMKNNLKVGRSFDQKDFINP